MNRFRRNPYFLILTTIFITGCAHRPTAGFSTQISSEQIRQQIHLKEASSLSAGVAKVEITPPVGTPLAGYSKRHGKPSTGIRDPLYVRAMVVSDEEDLAVLVSADLLLFPPPLAETLRREISEKWKIPRRAIILAGTHTHSGMGSIAPGFLYRFVFGPYKKEAADGLASRVLWAVQQAMDHRQPIRWGVGERLLDGFTENRMIPGGPIDPAVEILLVESFEGRPQAILVDAVAHPTLLGSDDMRFSADFPGELARAIETTYPGAVCLFFNGAAGDLRPRDVIGSNGEERVTRFGRVLAEVTTGLVSQMEVKSHGELATWGASMDLPTPQIYLGRVPVPARIGRMIRPGSTDVNLVSIDRTILVPLSAEMTTDLGQKMKRELFAQGFHAILIGYANGYLGYAVTPAQYKNRTYETWMTWYGPSLGELIVERVKQLAALYPKKQ